MTTLTLIVSMFALLSCAETQGSELVEKWKTSWWPFRVANAVFCVLCCVAFLYTIHMIEIQ